MAAADTDYHTRDLFEHIRDGEYPSWTLYVQVMPYEDARDYRFNPDDSVGARIEEGVRTQQGERDPKGEQQANRARESMQHKT
jgi:catalase